MLNIPINTLYLSFDQLQAYDYNVPKVIIMVKFLTLEYWKSVKEAANDDEEFKKGAYGFVATFTYKVTDKDDLPNVFMKFDDGAVTEVRDLNEGEKTEYTLQAPYDVWTQVSKGELDGPTAIMTRQMVFLGSMGTIMRYGKAFKRLLDLMKDIETEY